MKKIYISLLLLSAMIVTSSCNSEWEDEQYAQYVSFKAPINNKGVTKIYMRYNANGETIYQLPVVVSGSTVIEQDLNVAIDVDPDTLKVLNDERFHSRTDLYFQQLDEKHYSMPSSVVVPAGKSVGLFDIKFNFKDLNLVEKWVLPLTVVNDPSQGYQANMRKHYRKALLHVFPFNDYSGTYISSAMNVYFQDTGEHDAMTINERTAFVVDDKTVFFYAGMVDEELQQRGMYKILVNFGEEVKGKGKVTLTAAEPEIGFESVGEQTYETEVRKDELLPYLEHHYITLHLNYKYYDVTSVPGVVIGYMAKGTMTMERKINTQIPDVDQSIEW